MIDVDSYRVKLAGAKQLEELKVPITKMGSKQRKKIDRLLTKSSRRKPKGNFGISLEMALLRDGEWYNDLFIPKCLIQISRIVRGSLETEGLFRVCGSAARIREAQMVVDKGGEMVGTVHDAAGLIKLFFREMPEPLLTFRLYDAFVRAYRLPGPRQRAEAVLLLCLNLPRANRQLLRFLVDLLYDVVHSKDSRMTAFNLAAIFSPNILKPEGVDEVTTSDIELQNHAACVGVVEFLIENHHQIGRVPPHVLRHALEMKDEERARREYYRDVLGKRISWWPHRAKRRVGTAADQRGRRLDSVAALELIKGSELGIYEPRNGGHSALGTDTSAAVMDVFQVRRPLTVWESPVPLAQGEESIMTMTTTTTTTHHITTTTTTAALALKGGADKTAGGSHRGSLVESDAVDGPFGFSPVQGFDGFMMY